MPKTIAFVMDPMEGLQIAADTSFAFMLAAAAHDSRVFHVLPGDIMLRDGRVWLRGRYVEVRDKNGDHFDVVEKALVCANDCQAIFIRTDPPFDEDYLTCTWLLSFAERQGVRVVNFPPGFARPMKSYTRLSFQNCVRKPLSPIAEMRL